MRAFLSTIIFTLVLAGTLSAQKLTDAQKVYFDSVMTSTYAPNKPGATVLVAQNGKVLFRNSYGLANVELTIPNKPEYVFRIGSMSKQFTAVSILILAQEGELSLQDDITKHLPNYNTHGEVVTIEHLLTHTSGIPSYTEMEGFGEKMMESQTKKEIMDFFSKDKLLFKPGTDWSYSNSGYFLAGVIVEKVSGESLEDFMRTRIFEPLEMESTTTGSNNKIIWGGVSGYQPKSDTEFMPATYLNWSWPFGAGDLVSNVDNLLLWDEALYSDKILNAEMRKKAFESFKLADGQSANYGYGWAVSNFKGDKYIHHGGAINGFLSDGIRYEKDHVFVVVLSNNTGESPAKCAETIALYMAGQSFDKPKSLPTKAKELEDYVGTYEIHRMGSRLASNFGDDKSYRYVSVENDTLYGQVTGSAQRPAYKIGKDLFASPGGTMQIRFIREKKKVVAMEVSSKPLPYGPTSIDVRTSKELPKEKGVMELDAATLSKYAGTYDFGGGFMIEITIDGTDVFAKATGQNAAQVFPESEKKFFYKIVDASFIFDFDEEGNVTGLTLQQGGSFPAKKIK